MTVLQRTDLTTSQKIQCAAAAVAGQHAHGSKTALSETYEISRPTVYAVGAAAESVLRSHFEAPLLQGAAVDVRVDDAQLRRAVVALRVLAPNAIRPIEDLVPLLYPGVKVSYGTIQQMLVEAEGTRGAVQRASFAGRGRGRGARRDVQPGRAGAGRGGPRLGVSVRVVVECDARWGCVGAVASRGSVSGAGAVGGCEGCGEGDCRGGERGVSARAEQRDDCFHVLYEMHKVRRRLERRAYGAIEREGEALGRLGKIRACDKARRRKAKHALRRARGASAPRPSGDSMRSRRRWTRCAGRWSVSTSQTGELHRPEHVQALIEGVAQRIESLGVGECAKLAKYLRNRAPGLALAQKSVLPRLEALAEPLVGAGGELGVPVLVLGQGAAQASCARPASCAVSSSARRLRGTARPTWRGERIAARGRRGGAAPAPSRLECHRGVQCGTAPLSLCAQRCYPGLSRPVPCLVQSAHAALGTAQGDQRSRVPDRTAGPRLAHAARLSALADTALIHGRCRALASLDTPDPEHCVPRDRPARVCKDELPHFDRSPNINTR